MILNKDPAWWEPSTPTVFPRVVVISKNLLTKSLFRMTPPHHDVQDFMDAPFQAGGGRHTVTL